VADGIVLHGSLALGDYTPGHSDVDLLVIVARPLADGEITAVTDAIAADAREAPARAELRVVTREVAATPTPTRLLEVAIEIRASGDPAFHVERGPRAERDLVIEFSMCRAIGRSLAGAPATELIGHVPPDWILAVGDAQLADWQAIGDDPPHAQLTVLTACVSGASPTSAAIVRRLRRRSGRFNAIRL
jgi:predicted nucleotidyltransferase